MDEVEVKAGWTWSLLFSGGADSNSLWRLADLVVVSGPVFSLCSLKLYLTVVCKRLR